jgi:tetratricopeptide (TPR) repeat protein
MNSGSPRPAVSTPVIAILATCGGCLLITIVAIGLAVNAAVNSAPFLEMRSTTLRTQKRYGEAEALLVTSARKWPNNSRILNNLAWTYYLDGKYSEGEPYARHAVELDGNPNNVDTLAHIDLGLKRYDAAEKEFKSALKAGGNSAESHDGLGQVYERLGRYDKALNEYKSAVDLAPNTEGTQARIDRLKASGHGAKKKGGE